MLFVLVQRGDVFHAVQLAVHAHAHEALGLQFLEAVEVRSLLEFHQRGHDDDFRTFGQGEDVGDDFIGGARLDGASALWAIHLAEAGEEDAQEVVDFSDGADRGARLAAVVCCSSEVAGESPSILSTSGLSICGRNWRA